MKKLIYKMMMAVAVALVTCMTVGCEDEPNMGSDKNNYCYSLYTEYQNFNASNLDEFAPLWEDDCTIMFSINDTRDEADKKAVERFNQILSQIDDDKACAGLHGDDYMKAIMQRVEGRPHDLKSKTWTANGVE